jgi:hypothetical protein
MVVLSPPNSKPAVTAIENSLSRYHSLNNHKRVVFAARLVRDRWLPLRVTPCSRMLSQIEEVLRGLPLLRTAMLADGKMIQRLIRSNDFQLILATQLPLGQ